MTDADDSVRYAASCDGGATPLAADAPGAATDDPGLASVNVAGHLDAPFPYFGGKAYAAARVWEILGDVESYVEPFFGSGAVLLGRPLDHQKRWELVNDLDGFISNFWRAVQSDPDAVAHHCDWPINERDLYARHLWLVSAGRERLATMAADPAAFCPEVAGLWCWGVSQWVGSGWCAASAPDDHVADRRPHVGPRRGVRKSSVSAGMPDVYNGHHRGVMRVANSRPHVTHAQGITNADGPGDLIAWFRRLQNRLRRVLVLNGDWRRAVGSPSVLGLNSVTGPVGVFLDPPYDTTVRATKIYAHDVPGVAADVRAWCLENGGNKRLRIVLAGYDNEGHDEPLVAAGWRAIASPARHPGMGARSGNKNNLRETLWASPACLAQRQETLL